MDSITRVAHGGWVITRKGVPGAASTNTDTRLFPLVGLSQVWTNMFIIITKLTANGIVPLFLEPLDDKKL